MMASRKRTAKRAGLGLLLTIAGVLAVARYAGFGCASSPMPVAAPPPPAELLAGNWAGTWASSQNGMSGQLRCFVEKQSDDAYQARFDAVFAKLFTHTCIVTLAVQRKPDQWDFSGEKDLGLLNGGVYKYVGQSDGTDFVCTYDSAMDKGTFRLKRGATTQPAAP